MTNDEPILSIPEFFAGRDIFITGGTGFMGKILIEKLLRSCPNLNNIFILIRTKKNESIQQRIETLIRLPIFDQMRMENPENLKKLIPINGDVTQLQLGLSDNDRKRMENVSVIFHSAASVRFDDPLHEAIIMNTRGTREVLLFAEKLQNLKVILHVSTTYSNPRIHVVSEKIYPANGNWRDAIKIAETHPEYLDLLMEKYTNYEPNSYTYSKGLAEQIVNEYKDRLPVIIYRPSIVISALEEPIPGWIDNFNGPVGLLLASGIGLFRTAYGDPDIVSDFTPVDTSIRAMIIAAWKYATQSEAIGTINVYNCSTSLQRKFTTGFIVRMGEELSADIPMDKMLWRPGGCITRCKYDNFIKVILYHICTAYFFDMILKFFGHKKLLVRLQRKIFAATTALKYFMTTHWVFENDNFMSLQNYLLESDIKTFGYHNFITADVRDYLLNCMLGARRYLLHEKDEDIPKARIHYKRMAMLDKIVKFLFYSFLIYLAYSFIFLRIVEKYKGRTTTV